MPSSTVASTDRLLLSPADVTRAERDAVARAVGGGWFTPAGPEVDAFERELATLVGRRHGIATSCGTAALQLGLLTAGVGPGTIVITPTFTFAATVNAVLHTGATPLFVDCDELTGDLDIGHVVEALARLEARGQAASAVVPVDVYGRVTAHEHLLAVTEAAGVPVVSDAAESLGSLRHGVHGAAVGRAAAVSFNGNKIVSTSGGGMLLTDDDDVAERARRLAAQGREPVSHYLHREVGFNHRLSNVLAAAGRVQLSRLDEFTDRRRAVRRRYREAFSDLPGVELFGDDDASGNCWLTSVLLDPALGLTPDDLRLHLDARGIESRRLWNPLHRQPAYERHEALVSGAADRLFARGLSLPSGSTLSDDDVDRVVEAVAQVVCRRVAA